MYTYLAPCMYAHTLVDFLLSSGGFPGAWSDEALLPTFGYP